MGLPSAINLRIAQVDPATLIPAASRTNDNSGAFEQHLDATDTPAARAADRRDDQRQRDSSSNNSADTAQASTPGNLPASNSGQDTSSASTTTATSADQTAQASTEPTTGDTSAASTDATSTTPTTDAAPATSDAEATSAVAEAGLADAHAAVAGDAGKTAKSHDDKTGKDKAPDQSGDTTLAALLTPQPVPLQPATATASTPVQIAPASSAATPAPQPISPEDAALAAAAAAQSASGSAATNADGGANTSGGETELAIKPKVEGLGHQAAAAMAEKSSDRQAAQATPTATVQTANPQAVAAVETAATLTGNTGGTADDAGSQPVTATSGTLAAQLSDLQGAGNSQQNSANNTTIRIGTLPGQTTPSIVPSMAIALQIARNVQKGINRFDIRLDPPELGRIDVRMEVQRDGHVAAHLTVESAQTLDLLQRDQRALQQALTDAGLQTNSDSLSFSLRDQNMGGGAQGSAGNGGGSGGGSEIAPIEETAASSTQIYNLNLSASGGVDIRV